MSLSLLRASPVGHGLKVFGTGGPFLGSRERPLSCHTPGVFPHCLEVCPCQRGDMEHVPQSRHTSIPSVKGSARCLG